ncbi:MAG: hydroxymethylbilane synthase, partial [Armatimonadetes bacterium RBG_16_67_12]
MTVRVGTRGSALALAQTALVTAALEGLGLRTEVVTIRTQGDRNPHHPTLALGIGAFVKDLESALLDGHIDLAVHSAKDMPGAVSEGLALAAFLPREDPRDALIARGNTGLRELAPGAIIGTDSPRRRAFLLAARPDLVVQGIRGNVDTRLHKLGAGDVDALVLAMAGLTRLDLQYHVTEPLDVSLMLPAVGQGAVAVQVRGDDERMRERLALVDHAPTRVAVVAERAFLAALGGGCQRPIAALGTSEDDRLILEGAVLDAGGTRVIRDAIEGPASQAADLGEQL